MMAGAMWNFTYAGYHGRIDPRDVLHKGMTDIGTVISRLKDQVTALAANQPLVSWGFDPIFLTGERLNRHHLDKVANDRPVIVLFCNMHLMCVNSTTLEMVEYTRETNVEIGGKTNGIWNTSPTEIHSLCQTFQRHGIQMHIHANGDEASSVVLAALETAAQKHPWAGARHVLQHGQMMGADQFRRCAEQGLCANLFSNHIWYFGDQHAAQTIGEDRARRMNAARAALDAGVPLAIHSDAPITPMASLFTAWCAVNRRTMSGRTLGEAQRITVDEALYAITLGAAYTLKLDGEIGSIETGKVADFAVLGDDPTEVDPMALKDIPVLGTVSGGHVSLI